MDMERDMEKDICAGHRSAASLPSFCAGAARALVTGGLLANAMTEPRCAWRHRVCGQPCRTHRVRLLCGRMDLNDNVSSLLDQERQTRRDEVAIDLEDRSTKKGTPPIPSEAGDIRDLRGAGTKPTQAG